MSRGHVSRVTHLARLVAAASLARARAHEEGADVVAGAGVLPGHR